MKCLRHELRMEEWREATPYLTPVTTTWRWVANKMRWTSAMPHAIQG